jgi:hypothetical protein
VNQYSNKYTEEDYKNKCAELGVEYVGSEKGKIGKRLCTIIKYICAKHIDKGVQETDWGHFKNQKKSCKYCSGRHKTTDEAQELIRNPNIKFISEYRGAEKPIRCLCDKCGNEWITNRPIDLFKRDGGCPYCGKINRGLSRRKTIEEFIVDIQRVNPDIEIVGDYLGAHKPIKCRCKIDNHVWESYPCNLLNGSAGCPICNMSSGERAIIEFLESLNISYTKQKTFEGCSDIMPLRFDVYDEENNIAIEFQGEQHYFPVDFAGYGDEYATEQYKKLKTRDKIKEDYCAANNIRLIKIPYWERGNEQEFLINNKHIYKEKYTA